MMVPQLAVMTVDPSVYLSVGRSDQMTVALTVNWMEGILVVLWAVMKVAPRVSSSALNWVAN